MGSRPLQLPGLTPFLSRVTSLPLMISSTFGLVMSFYQICLGTGPRGTLIPKKIINFIASFLSIFESSISCVSLVNCPDRLNSSLKTSLLGRYRVTSVNGFGQNELERCLALPTSKILERHNHRTILDFLLMKLRTALDRVWLQSLPTLHKVLELFSLIRILSE